MANLETGRPLRIAMFCERSASLNGSSVFDLARGIAEEGAEVDLFSLRGEGETEFETVDAVRVHRAGPIDLRKPVRLHSQLAPRLVQLAYRSLRDNRPDVIHAHGTSFTALVAAGVAQVLKRPLVTSLHDEPHGATSLPRRIPAFAYDHSLGRAILRASDRVIAVEPCPVRETIDVYVDALAERELRWFLQHQVA